MTNLEGIILCQKNWPGFTFFGSIVLFLDSTLIKLNHILFKEEMLSIELSFKPESELSVL